MTPVVYEGPFAEVVIEDTGIVASRGEPVEVDDDLADRLCEQPTWRRADETGPDDTSVTDELDEVEPLDALEDDEPTVDPVEEE